MKNLTTLLREIEEVESLEELESGADLFSFGVDKGSYTTLDIIKFNETYWNIKNKLITDSLKCKIKIGYLQLFDIVKDAPVNIKDNESCLLSYVNDRLKALVGKKKFQTV